MICKYDLTIPRFKHGCYLNLNLLSKISQKLHVLILFILVVRPNSFFTAVTYCILFNDRETLRECLCEKTTLEEEIKVTEQ